MQIKLLITDPISELGLDKLKDIGYDVLYRPDSSEDEIHSLLHDIDGWIIRSGTKITKDFIQDANRLQIIGRAGVGTDNIDILEATSKGVIVMNVPDGNTISAAEHTMAMILSLSRNIQLGHMGMIKGKWNRHNLTGTELQNKILGVVGLGKIGKEVINRAKSYNMRIYGYDPYISQDQFDEKEVKIVTLDELTEMSDYITIHVPINESTKNLFNYARLTKMKKTSRIINVARGGIINENDLALALNEELISGAAIDVFVNEPIDEENPLLKAKNILLTPHLGASTFEAKEGVSISICNQIINYFEEGKLSNALNLPISDHSVMKRMLPYYKLTEKMGMLVSQMMNSPVKNVKITCFGDAEDSKSISLIFMKGLLSNITDNRVNMINANIITNERGINFSHSYNNENTSYMNLIKCVITSEKNNIEISGSIFSDNHMRIVNVMGYDIDLDPSGNMLFIKNKDVPGVVGKIGTLLGELNVNIAGYLLCRIKNNNFAFSVIKLDAELNNQIINKIAGIDELIEINQVVL